MDFTLPMMEEDGMGRELVYATKFQIPPTTNNHQRTTINFSFRHTKDIIKALESGNFPNQVMITIHPQRWNDEIIPWAKELVMQNLKNVVKRFVIGVRP